MAVALMDRHGSCTLEDAALIRNSLRDHGAVVFAFSENQIDSYIITLSQPVKLGTMPFGGNPDGRIYVGIYGKGCNHIGPSEVHEGYLEEKLNLDRGGAESIAKLWKGIWENG